MKCAKCNKEASFGNEWKKPLFCKSHSTDSMYNVLKKTCDFHGCRKRPSYGFDGYNPIRCKEHIQIGMIDVNSKRCEIEGFL